MFSIPPTQTPTQALHQLRCISCNTITNVTEITMLVIAILGVTQVMSGSAVGWTTIALGVGGMVTTCLGTDAELGGLLTANKILPTLVVIVLGGLGAGGVLSAAQVGWGVIGTGLIGTAFTCACVIGFNAGIVESTTGYYMYKTRN